MKEFSESLQEYIQTGEYYKDALKWYNFKYLNPLTQRSQLLIFLLVFFTLFFSIATNMYFLFPIVKKVRYAVHSENTLQTNAKITRANFVENNPLLSVVNLRLTSYIQHRETYDNDMLEKQLNFVKNNSTKVVYRKFYNFMNIDNPNSPSLRYQNYIRRTIEIVSISYKENDGAVVKFMSVAKANGGKIIEHMLWQADVSYEIDKIDPKLTSGSPYNFVITNYKLKLLEDKTSKSA